MGNSRKNRGAIDHSSLSQFLGGTKGLETRNHARIEQEEVASATGTHG